VRIVLKNRHTEFRENLTNSLVDISRSTAHILEIRGSFLYCKEYLSRSQGPRVLRRGFTAARLLGFWVRITPGASMSVCCECCVLSGRGLCGELITSSEESYRLGCVAVCDLETL
jgi:hypothetical protein